MLKKVNVWPRTLSDAIYNTSSNIHRGVLDELVNKNIKQPPFITLLIESSLFDDYVKES